MVNKVERQWERKVIKVEGGLGKGGRKERKGKKGR
jgi:hypothetical protein